MNIFLNIYMNIQFLNIHFLKKIFMNIMNIHDSVIFMNIHDIHEGQIPRCTHALQSSVFILYPSFKPHDQALLHFCLSKKKSLESDTRKCVGN